LLIALISLDKNTPFSPIQTIIGLPNFAPTSVSGFSLSMIAIAYAQTSLLVTFSSVEKISQSNNSSTSFETTSVSVSE
jgi:hypothetical protein